MHKPLLSSVSNTHKSHNVIILNFAGFFSSISDLEYMQAGNILAPEEKRTFP